MKTFILLNFFLLNVITAVACTCADLTAEDLLQESDTVVLAIAQGDSVEIIREQSDEDDWVGTTGMLTSFKVITNYKSVGKKSINVITNPPELGSCGANFKSGEVVVLSTIQHPTTFEMVASACSVSWLDNSKTYELMMKLDLISKR